MLNNSIRHSIDESEKIFFFVLKFYNLFLFQVIQRKSKEGFVMNIKIKCLNSRLLDALVNVYYHRNENGREKDYIICNYQVLT